jgi:uncharacterized protein YegL
MAGDPIESVKAGIRALHSELLGDPSAVESAYLSVITFDSSARQLAPLTEVSAFSPPDLVASGTTALGAALKLLIDCFNSEIRKNSTDVKGDWKPLVFLLTDGAPTDSWHQYAAELKAKKPGNIVALACGDGADPAMLKNITDIVLEMKTMTPFTRTRPPQDPSCLSTLGARRHWSASLSHTETSVPRRSEQGRVRGSSMLAPGTAIGRYVVRRRLAEGGMAEVYLAQARGPEGFSKDVVIKVVRSFLASDQQFIDMFINEARLSSRLNHANVVQIFDFGKHEQSYFIAMEYVRGTSLFDLRKRCRDRADIVAVSSSWVANLFVNEVSAMNAKIQFKIAPFTYPRDNAITAGMNIQ